MPRPSRLLALACSCALIPAAATENAAAGIWTEIPTGTAETITAIEYQSPTRFWFTTSSGAIYTRRPDGSFARTRPPSGVPLNDIEFQTDRPIGLAVGNGGQVMRSTDHGQTWTAVTGIPVSRATGFWIDCTTSEPLHDVSSVRFAGPERAWIFAAGSQVATSQPSDPRRVGETSTWTDANRDVDDSCKLPLPIYNRGYADAFFIPWNPGTGYIVAANASVFLTSNNLATPGLLKPATAGHRLAGDPQDPSRMWSSSGDHTRDGWHTDTGWKLGNPSARVYPRTGPADVAFADGTVLAAGSTGLVLDSVDGETFYYNSADGALETHRWNAASLANATHGAIGGDNGKLAVTTQADFVPPPPPPPPPDPPTKPRPKATPAPTTAPAPRVGRYWTTGTVLGSVLVNGRPLTSGRRLPFGTNVDARNGTLTINVAVNALTSATHSATVSKGIFQVSQRRRGATASSSITLETPRGKNRVCAARRGPPKGIVRTLKGAVTGSFTIVGKVATATVRNASWVVEDGCKGTRVRNIRGRVSIKRKSAKRAKTVRPNRSYVVKARLFGAKRTRDKR